MLLNTTDKRQYDGNLEGETINVGIADVRLIIDRLTDMYADREMAVIREYSCNALDAHIEAGVTAPIEVSTPGPMEPFLTIRDYGVGLCLEDIRSIYSQYGASTKRNTNTQTGAFGLGCKSGLAYSDQFTVTSVKDGVRIQVVVSRDPSAGITMKVVDTSDTPDPNGTTIMIPARGGNDFERKAKAFFKYWQKGTVKLNGVEPEHMPGAQWVTDTICINPEQTNQSYVVMGGVPYPVSINVGLGYYKGITAFVPIGSCEPKPDREALIDSDGTVDTLRQVAADFRAGLHDAIRKDVEGASSPREAAKLKREWNQSVGSQNMPANLVYKGRQVPDSYECEFDVILALLYGRKMNAHTTYQKGRFIPLLSVNGALWVTGFDYVSFTATVKKKLDKYCDDNNIQRTCYILAQTDQKPDTTWLEDVKFIDWPTIKAIKLPKNVVSTSNGRIPGSYDLFESGDFNPDVPADDIDTTHDLFFMVGRYYEGSRVADWLNQSYPGCTLVMMRRGREDKFKRLFPKAQDANAVVQADFKKWAAAIDKDAAYALYARQNSDSRLKTLDAARVDDPDIKRAVKIIDTDTTDLQAEINAWHKLGYYYDPSEHSSEIIDPLDKYPLLPEPYYFNRFMRSTDKADAVYRYLNCEYAFQKAQGA